MVSHRVVVQDREHHPLVATIRTIRKQDLYLHHQAPKVPRLTVIINSFWQLIIRKSQEAVLMLLAVSCRRTLRQLLTEWIITQR